MSKIKLLTIAIIGLLLINLATLSFLFLQQPLHPTIREGGFAHEGPKKIIIDNLHFDKEQVKQYEAIIQEHRTALRELESQIMETKRKLYTTLTAEPVIQIDSFKNRISELQEQIENLHYNHFAQIKKICRLNQLVYFNALAKDLVLFFKQGKPMPEDGPPPSPGD